MERVAWIEMLARNGAVESRHPVSAWPVRIGRGYDCDVILDDPYVAPLHCVISEAGAKQFSLEPLSPGNGVQVAGRQLDQVTLITSDDVIRCGHTQFRIRPADYPVPPEQAFSRHLTLRDPPALVLALIFLLGITFLDAWLDYTHENLASKLFFDPVAMCLLALALAIPWALAGQAASGKGNYVAHAAATTLLFGSIEAVFILTELFRYAFISDWPTQVGVGLVFLSIALALYYQSRLALRTSAKVIAVWCAVVAFGLVSFWQISDWLDDRKDMEKMAFNRAVAPPALLVTKGESVEEFVSAATVLRTSVDGVGDGEVVGK